MCTSCVHDVQGARARGACVDAFMVSWPWCWLIFMCPVLRSIWMFFMGSALRLIWMVLIGSALRSSLWPLTHEPVGTEYESLSS